MVSLSIDGRVLSQGSLSDALALDKKLLADINAEKEALEKSEEQVEPHAIDEAIKKVEGKLIVQEDVAEGFVSWNVCKRWLDGLASGHPYLFWTVSIGGISFVSITVAINAWWLGQWAAQYDEQHSSEVDIF